MEGPSSPYPSFPPSQPDDEDFEPFPSSPSSREGSPLNRPDSDIDADIDLRGADPEATPPPPPTDSGPVPPQHALPPPLKIDLKVQTAAALVDDRIALERQKSTRPITTGCGEIDGQVLLTGGLRRGEVVGVSGEGEEVGVLVCFPPFIFWWWLWDFEGNGTLRGTILIKGWELVDWTANDCAAGGG